MQIRDRIPEALAIPCPPLEATSSCRPGGSVEDRLEPVANWLLGIIKQPAFLLLSLGPSAQYPTLVPTWSLTSPIMIGAAKNSWVKTKRSLTGSRRVLKPAWRLILARHDRLARQGQVNPCRAFFHVRTAYTERVQYWKVLRNYYLGLSVEYASSQPVAS